MSTVARVLGVSRSNLIELPSNGSFPDFVS
jgi:predicted DNA-binding transcriptional regulator AlpA